MKKIISRLCQQDKAFTRREFLGSAAVAAAFTFVPKHVFGSEGKPSANEKVNIAGVGVGGMGQGNLAALESENIVALCDVDEDYAGKVFAKYPQAKIYRDFREMLDKQKDIDAVVVATPDHTHAAVAAAAMQCGKHVYVQKPLTYSVYEARKLTELAAQYPKLITQMGNQGRSGEGVRLICEWIWSGAIGQVREVHAWTNRPAEAWYYDITRKRPIESMRVPDTLDWSLWLGPAPERPYHRTYLPGCWRVWWDFGTGALGDMGCHVLDPVWWALKLGYPTSVESSSTNMANLSEPDKRPVEAAPFCSLIHYTFPARENMPEVKVHWYDGGMLPERPEELEPGRKMGDGDGGVIFVGDKGKIMCGCYSRNPRLIPESKMQEFKRPEKTIERITTSHELNWIEGIKTGKKPCSSFDVAGPFTEMVLLGNLTLRLDQKIEWDGKAMKATNCPDADVLINRPSRSGWSI